MNLLIPERLKTLRELKNLTQTDLAKKLGITRSSVNAWEMGISVPSTEKIVELALLFNVSSDYILGICSDEVVNIAKYSDYEKKIIFNLLSYFDDKNIPN